MNGGRLQGTNFPLVKEGREVTTTGGVMVLMSRKVRELGFTTERATEIAVFAEAPGFPLFVGLYDPHEESNYADETHFNNLAERIEEKRAERERKGESRFSEVCVMGDFNAHTGKKTPLIVWTGKGGGEGEEWAQTSGREEVFRPERESEDETENTKGRALIRFCEMVGIVPLNGLRRCAVEEGGEKNLSVFYSLTSRDWSGLAASHQERKKKLDWGR
uniref:Endonuclease/exonuclease/phosphatase domain-containing protein n=1 Tax=Chromera velia CCMP2878 TaxID=1169474 RepID=A0A0G4HNP5_9ALVE|eukprot:Cvel_29580.t1-p1 / transcript=Cvel_29580.t1 / gene=Cvel_29580 / organism=Chromera_velia_CCMP2878 / gene_product=hypothetical protein / transcript_product=hypothetical protein / location=Cvel_scaffold4070:9123-11698(+) / protein_length=217 / sequence_SO=supercontig / SO=protein_coding / is_pseudo=false